MMGEHRGPKHITQNQFVSLIRMLCDLERVMDIILGRKYTNNDTAEKQLRQLDPEILTAGDNEKGTHASFSNVRAILRQGVLDAAVRMGITPEELQIRQDVNAELCSDDKTID